MCSSSWREWTVVDGLLLTTNCNNFWISKIPTYTYIGSLSYILAKNKRYHLRLLFNLNLFIFLFQVSPKLVGYKCPAVNWIKDLLWTTFIKPQSSFYRRSNWELRQWPHGPLRRSPWTTWPTKVNIFSCFLFHKNRLQCFLIFFPTLRTCHKY